MFRALLSVAILVVGVGVTTAQDASDTSYRPSPTVTARQQRTFLNDIRWSVGVEARDQLREAFSQRSHLDIWQDLVAADGLTTGNVVDALTSYWVLNWIVANGAYDIEIDHAPVREQLELAFRNDRAFQRLGDQQRQELAEGYILNFLLEHAALRQALEQRDPQALMALSAAAVTRFRQKMRVNLLTIVPGPQGFTPRPTGR
jgi:hypothetical protein